MATPSFELREPISEPVEQVVTTPRAWTRWELAGACLVLAAVYFVAARVGLRLAVINASSSAIFPAAGVALAVLLRFGYRLWPGVFAGALFANFATTGILATSVGVATGNTLEALAAAWLLNRFAHGPRVLDRIADILRLVSYAGLAATAVAATIGTVTIALGGLAQWREFDNIWITWWLGDAGGVIIVTPAVLLWTANARIHWPREQMLEAVALLGGLSVTCLAVFGFLALGSMRGYPLEFLCAPFLVWAAYRFGRREAATAVLLVSVIATAATVRGMGPFAVGTPNESLILLQAYAATGMMMSLILAEVVAERERGEEQLRWLAVTDALTGLANYRQLLDVLEVEIRRSGRTGRSFSILLLDLDRLKDINDRHGHLTGSKALCRVADALRSSCRVLDTAARYGGDEFALVLPETDDDAARHAALRIATDLAQDGQSPPLSVSVGLAIYPRDGRTAEALLSSADLMLYEMKRTLDDPAAAR